jgi:hypothetical protein
LADDDAVFRIIFGFDAAAKLTPFRLTRHEFTKIGPLPNNSEDCIDIGITSIRWINAESLEGLIGRALGGLARVPFPRDKDNPWAQATLNKRAVHVGR